MKRTLTILLSVLLICAICCGCGAQKEADLKSVVNDINTKHSLSGLTEVEDLAKLNRYYQIDENDVKSFSAEFSTDASEFTEVIVIEAVNSDAASRIAALLNTHLDSRVSEGKSYNQDAVPVLEQCRVNIFNNRYVVLVISEDARTINDEIMDSLR